MSGPVHRPEPADTRPDMHAGRAGGRSCRPQGQKIGFGWLGDYSPGRYPPYSICELEAVMRVAGVKGSDGILTILRPLHCVNWSEMPKELQCEVMHQVLAIFEEAT